MLISTKGRYALRMMIDIAENEKAEKFVSLKKVAERQDISMKYLENIVKDLVKANLVEGTRGKGGGYRLTHKTDKIKITSILLATEGTLAPVACLESKRNHCKRSCDCKALSLWSSLYENLTDFFSGVTLKDVLEENK